MDESPGTSFLLVKIKKKNMVSSFLDFPSCLLLGTPEPSYQSSFSEHELILKSS